VLLLLPRVRVAAGVACAALGSCICWTSHAGERVRACAAASDSPRECRPPPNPPALRLSRAASRSTAKVVAFGHIGDGNLHLNISTPTKSQAVFDKIEPWVFEWTSDKRGSISAEHGIGAMKGKYLHMSKSKETIALMQQIKHLMDPNGILNPYKVLPESTA
jgi:FAD/FMN-containing dehydrogenase